MSDDKFDLDKELAKAQEELTAASADLAAWEARWDNYTGNNPDKYRASIKQARRRVTEAKYVLAGLSILKGGS